MFGLSKPSITLRVGCGKILGLLVGVIAYIALTIIAPETDFFFRFGFVIWYLSFGAIIGLMGVFTTNPLFNINFSWWLRGLIAGAWFNFVLLMYIYEKVLSILVKMFGPQSLFSSPWWLVVEGAIIGLLFDYLLTRIAGEGAAGVAELK